MFTSATIVTSAVLFQGFKGSGTEIATVIMGFLQICSGVVLLQLSKSAKDVPDAAVFKGDLDQIREVVTQEEPEYEPKADSIRGAASILRRISTTRRDAEADEARRFVHDKHEDFLKPPGENEIVEWDGIRRRKTVIGEGPTMSRPSTSRSPSIKQPLPPLGMSRFPDPDEEERRPSTKQSGHSFLSDIRSGAGSVLHPHWRPLNENDEKYLNSNNTPVTMTEMTGGAVDTEYHGAGHEGLGAPFRPTGRERSDTPRSIHWADEKASEHGPETPVHAAQRQFSFNSMFNRIRNGSQNSLKPPASPPRGILRRAHLSGGDLRKSATEEERLGLVKGDSRTAQSEETTFGEKLERWSSSDSDLGEVQPMHPGRPHGDSVSSMSTSAFPAYEDHHALYSHDNVSNPYYLPPSRQATASPEHDEDGWQRPSGNRPRARSNSSHARAPPPSQSSFSTHRHPNPLPPLPDERAFSGESGVRSVSSGSSDLGVASISSSTEARDDDHHAQSPPSYPARRQSGWRRHISQTSSDGETHPERRPGNSGAFV
jgi:hypothetical protein